MEQCILKFVFQHKALCLFYVMLQSGDVHRSSKLMLACCTSINLCSICLLSVSMFLAMYGTTHFEISVPMQGPVFIE